MEERLLRKAKKQVKKKKDFYTHAMVIAATAVFLSLIAFLTMPRPQIMLIPIAAMFLSVAIHYISVFGLGGINKGLDNWEANALEEEYLKLKQLEDRKVDLLDEDRLRLKQLEKRYEEGDFV